MNAKQKLTVRIVHRTPSMAKQAAKDETIDQATVTALKWHTAQIDELADHIRGLNAKGITVVKPEQAGALHMIYMAGGAVDLLFGTVGWKDDDDDASMEMH